MSRITGTASDEWHPGPGVEWTDRSRVVHELHGHEGGPPDPAQEAADPFLPQTRPEPDAAGARMPPVGAPQPALDRQRPRTSQQHAPRQRPTAAPTST
jgi:hypothetical protein